VLKFICGKLGKESHISVCLAYSNTRGISPARCCGIKENAMIVRENSGNLARLIIRENFNDLGNLVAVVGNSLI
jgi:hypothetical protein